MITEIKGNCQYPGCSATATHLAADNEGEGYIQQYSTPGVPGVFCQEHAEAVLNSRSPEYTVVCPNCACRFGVG